MGNTKITATNEEHGHEKERGFSKVIDQFGISSRLTKNKPMNTIFLNNQSLKTVTSPESLFVEKVMSY